MRKCRDLTGERFGRLVVIGAAPRSWDNRIMWRCLCDCGKETTVESYTLTSGHSKSCGCLLSDKTIARCTTHGETKTRLHRIWMQMRGRCNSPTNPSYKNYGGRGIKVCDEWNNYIAFATWAREYGYQDDLTIDRIDNDGNYEPTNCRWVDRKTQNRNKRNNRYVEYTGDKKTIADWCDATGISSSAIRRRIDCGWDVGLALTKPPITNNKPRYITYNGETKSVSEWARNLGIGGTTLRYRLSSGWSVEDAFTQPLDKGKVRYKNGQQFN